jgi:polyhydroxyalkanoate synthesis regulator phasin
MNPETKIILDELNRRFTEHDQKWDSRFADQDARLSRQIRDLEQAQEARMSKLERVTASLDEWRPSIEGPSTI